MKKINTHAPAMPLSLKPAVRALALAGALSLPLAAWAQAVPIDFEAEGVVTDIYAHPDGSAVDLTVFGRVMRVPLGATIHTPSATLSLEQLADPTPFPGRGAIPGFLGGTAILIGEVHVTLNDTDPNGNLDVTTIQLTNVPPELLVQDLDTGDLQVTASAAGTYSFNYTVADTEGLISNVATVVIQAQPVAMDTVDITRANYRTDKDRWEARGTSNQAGSVVTVTLMRTNQVLATVTADATGAWQLDARNTGITAIAGDVVRASSNGGGSDELAVTISR